MRAIVGTAPPPTNRLSVSVSHGDLGAPATRCSSATPSRRRWPGPSPAATSSSAARSTQRQGLGLYPDTAGQPIATSRASSHADRIAGCLVLGLDPSEQLTRSRLTKLVRMAAIDFANQWSSSGKTEPPRLSAVAAGSGPVLEMRVEDSVAAICDGILAANVVLRSKRRPAIAHLELVDRYAGKVEKIRGPSRRPPGPEPATPTRSCSTRR